jgi:hypothetical protein
MPRYKQVNNELIELTGTELAELEAKEQAWIDGALDRELDSLRAKRNKALVDSDWTILGDVPLNPAMKSAWMNYRTLLRNITDNLTTVEDVKAVTLPIPPK